METCVRWKSWSDESVRRRCGLLSIFFDHLPLLSGWLAVKSVVVYDQRGDRLAIWNPGDEVLRRPHGIATTPRGEVIVTDTARSAVCIFAVGGGHLLRQFGCKGDHLQQLRLPFYCAFDPDREEILVSDNLNYCVKIFDGRTAGKSGGYLRRIGSGTRVSQKLEEGNTHRSAVIHTGNVFMPRDLDL